MFDRNQAVALWHKYNESESLWHHALSVEAVMRHFAALYGEDVEYWGLVGLLHDIDWEKYPEEHCRKAPEILKEIGADDDFIHAVCSHGWSICTDVEPVKKMEKVLFTIDELTGLVTATALMRPEKMNGITVKSVKKKWSSKGFAAGVNRDIITKGAELLGEELPFIIDNTIKGMTGIAKDIGLWVEEA
ncbi:MAG: HDIG domain-containing protein [Candidatus Ornithospirochaeta sp.]|nr:HDIG domain-containing protein [Sphaerochaetaceae bacterium]MDD7162568.1 HDIG domain-containing protein [Sphaerochaetaceae bacterium]MDY5524159.1 HDIG domain-containing protein [Candidatus Ornithospirochaeta sp.]